MTKRDSIDIRMAFNQWAAGKVIWKDEKQIALSAFIAGNDLASLDYDAAIYELNELIRVAMTRPPEILVDYIKSNWPQEYNKHSIAKKYTAGEKEDGSTST